MLRCSIGLTCVLWAACSFAQSSPTPIAAGSTAKVVCKSESEEVVLHANASATLPVVDILPCGAEVTVVWKQAGWYRVRTQGGKEGWVKETFFSATSPVEQATSHIKDGYINCSSDAAGVHLYESVEGLRAIMMVHCGEKIAVLEEIQRETGNWDKIETSGGSVGYLWSGFVSWSPPTAQARGAAGAQGGATKDNSPNASGVAAPPYSSTGVYWGALQATKMLRDGALDPGSFTLLQATSYTKTDKKGRTEYGGCVHFVASNAFGGRVQQWGWYKVDKYDGQFRYGFPVPYDPCNYSKDAVVADVTAEVKKALSQEGGQ